MSYVLAINGDAHCLLGQDGGVMVADEDGELDPNGAVRLRSAIPAGTELEVVVSHPTRWNGWVIACPRCSIDPKDCGEH